MRTGDLLSGRRKFLDASSTCGLVNPVRYCRIGLQHPNVKQNKQNFKQKQELNFDNRKICYVCDSRQPYDQYNNTRSHRIENIVNGGKTDSKKWWQSETNKDDVYIQFELENEFLLSYIYMKFKGFRPQIMFIEKSSDYGLTWKPISFYAENCNAAYPGVNKSVGRQSTLGVATCKEHVPKGDPNTDGLLFHRLIDKGIDLYAPENLNALKITNVRFNFTKLVSSFKELH